jgi:hypothetical protein
VKHKCVEYCKGHTEQFGQYTVNKSPSPTSQYRTGQKVNSHTLGQSNTVAREILLEKEEEKR